MELDSPLREAEPGCEARQLSCRPWDSPFPRHLCAGLWGAGAQGCRRPRHWDCGRGHSCPVCPQRPSWAACPVVQLLLFSHLASQGGDSLWKLPGGPLMVARVSPLPSSLHLRAAGHLQRPLSMGRARACPQRPLC